MSTPAPWRAPDWAAHADAASRAALTAAGRPPTGPIQTRKAWGRSCIRMAPTGAGEVWIKHGYRLPPGEERVLAPLATRWAHRLPGVVTTWDGAVALDPLPGRELSPDDPSPAWIDTARALGEITAGERSHAREWLDLGVRDRRPAAWPATVSGLAESPVLDALDPAIRDDLERLLPDLVTRYVDAFASPATLVPQDPGCCNVHITDAGPMLFDWADVVVGHPVFACDRLLDQAPREIHEAVIDAFRAPLALPAEEFRAMRRSNVIHEVIRYHDELAYLADDDPLRASLAGSVCSQLRVLVEFETSR